MAQELQPGERFYRIGVNADCPVHAITAGGQCFPRYSEDVTGYGSETVRSRVKGAIVVMTEAQLAACIESAKTKVIRSTKGRKRRSRVHSKDGRRYRTMEGDEPAVGYMYAIPLDGPGNPHQDAAYPTLAPAEPKVPQAPKRRAAAKR